MNIERIMKIKFLIVCLLDTLHLLHVITQKNHVIQFLEVPNSK